MAQVVESFLFMRVVPSSILLSAIPFFFFYIYRITYAVEFDYQRKLSLSLISSIISADKFKEIERFRIASVSSVNIDRRCGEKYFLKNVGWYKKRSKRKYVICEWGNNLKKDRVVWTVEIVDLKLYDICF